MGRFPGVVSCLCLLASPLPGYVYGNPFEPSMQNGKLNDLARDNALDISMRNHLRGMAQLPILEEAIAKGYFHFRRYSFGINFYFRPEGWTQFTGY